MTEGTPTDVPLQRRGEPENPGPVVPHGVPRFAFLAGERPAAAGPGSSGRHELARWLTRPGHPLTARVMVNRIWQHHFGRGIVATPSNFGVRGEPPTHPELLDWLAARFVAEGWSIKAIHREIVLSATYQLSSDHDARDAALDPDDRWLWRFPRRRLDAESIRDAMLAVSGRLDPGRPGRHPFPPIEDWHWTQHDAFKTVYPVEPPQRLPDDPAPGEAPVPRALRRPGHQHLDRRPRPARPSRSRRSTSCNNPFVAEHAPRASPTA